jgi:hypothetical protein
MERTVAPIVERGRQPTRRVPREMIMTDSAPSPSTGEIHMSKECSEYTGLAGSFCTITRSNIPAIPVGARVVYASAAGETGLDSDITVEAGDGTTIEGHVVLDMVSNTGTVVLHDGTGPLAGFSADTEVSYDGDEWQWDGTFKVTDA